MLQHVYRYWVLPIKNFHIPKYCSRSENYSRVGFYVKSFYDPTKVLTVHNHYPISCLDGSCTSFSVDTSVAQLQHYRKDCVPELKTVCEEIRNNSVVDTSIWRWREQLVARTNEVLVELGYSRGDDYNW